LSISNCRTTADFTQMHPGLLQATQTSLDRPLQLPLILSFYSGTSIVILILS